MGLRNNVLSTLAVTISLLLAFSFVTVASCLLLDEDSRIEAYSRCSIYLSKLDDLVDTEDFYDLRMIIASRIQVEDVLPNPAWSGPITTSVYVYLPGDASSIYASRLEDTVPYMYQPQGLQGLPIEPEIQKSGNFVRVQWELSSERFGLARTWSFIDRVEYSISFVVPQNASVTAYAYVQTAFYAYRGIYYSQLADEKVYWLEVKNTNETTAQPQAIETGEPILIFDRLGIDFFIAAVVSVMAFWHFKRYKQHSPMKIGANEQGILKADYRVHHARTWGIMILAAAVAFLGVLAIIVGSIQFSFDASYAISLLASGFASSLIALGLFWVKPWAWYAAVGLMIIHIVDYFLLFTTPTALTIPFEPFILIYLIVIRHRFL